MFRSSGLFFRFLLLALGTLSAAPIGAQNIYCAGPTVLLPLYVRWFQEYKEQKGITVIYQTLGSGGSNFTAHAVDFSLSDAPMNPAEMAAAPGILHIPTVIHTVALVYNLPGLKAGLHLTGPIVADIYLGKITRWNDHQIARLNPGLALPDLAIFPVHQSYGSGTTYLLTNYLSAVSSDWKQSVGAGKSVHWPVGLGGKSEYVQMIKQNKGSIGYTELTYAVASGLPIATVQNAKGKFVLPTVEAAMEEAKGTKLTPDLRGSIVNSPAPNGYPIVGFNYFLAYRTGTHPEVKDFLTWCLTTGQKDAAELQYAPLSANVHKRALEVIAGMK